MEEIFPKNTLWLKFIKGDDKAISKIYIQYINELFDYGCKLAPDRELVKDCIQEVFISLIRNRKNLSESVYLKGYLFKAVKRKIVSEIVKKRNYEEVIQSDDYRFEIKLEKQNDIGNSDDIEGKRITTIQLAINTLTSRQKEALYLRFYKGMKHKEIASILNLSQQSSRALLSRALNRIKELMDGHKNKLTQILFLFFKQTKHVL